MSATNEDNHNSLDTQNQPSVTPLPRHPVIFLDIDGVLNRTKHATHIRLEPDLVERFRQLVEATNAHIVLSTFWRYFHEYIAYILHRHGIAPTQIIGCTPGRNLTTPGGCKKDEHGCCSNSKPNTSNNNMMGRSSADAAEYANRAEEILAWLQANPERGNCYVILDDRPTAAHPSMMDRFVHVQTNQGLTDHDVQRAVAILELGSNDSKK